MGLHMFLSEDEELRAAATEHKVTIKGCSLSRREQLNIRTRQ